MLTPAAGAGTPRKPPRDRSSNLPGAVIQTGRELQKARPATKDYANRLPVEKREAKPGAPDRKAYMRAYMAKRKSGAVS